MFNSNELTTIRFRLAYEDRGRNSVSYSSFLKKQLLVRKEEKAKTRHLCGWDMKGEGSIASLEQGAIYMGELYKSSPAIGRLSMVMFLEEKSKKQVLKDCYFVAASPVWAFI